MKEYIVITGASSGIGQALAVELANKGHHIIAIGRNEVGLKRTQKLAGNGSITSIIADLSQKDSLDNIAKFFNSETTIKYLVHSAAVLEPLLPLLQATQQDLTLNLITNVLAPLSLTSKLKPYFTPNTRVLFIGSDYVGVEGKIRPNITGAYSMAKTALRMAVEYLRRESEGVALIGYLNPGSTQTPIYASFWKAINGQKTLNDGPAPATPINVAKFIAQVLETSDNKTFSSIDWDFRKQPYPDNIAIPSLRARL